MEVYVKAAQDAVVSALNGLNACVLAYGQRDRARRTTFGPNGTIEGGGVRAAAHTGARQ